MDLLAPIGLGLFIMLFVIALVRTARQQRQAQTWKFSDFAAMAGFQFHEMDPGIAEKLAEGFRGFGTFHSPSLGRVQPMNVVTGGVDEGELCVFVHSTRVYEGYEREWFVCILRTENHLCSAASIERRRGRLREVTELGGDPIVSFRQDLRFERMFVVVGQDADRLRLLLASPVRELLLERTPRLPFVPGIQLRGDRVAVYLADRNADLADVDEVGQLVAFTRDLARSLVSRT